MKIAVTTWGNRVSPVFDSAGTILIAEITDRSVRKIAYESFTSDNLAGLIHLLNKTGVTTLLCGAISTRPAKIIADADLRLITFVSGNAMEVLTTFARKQTLDPAFMMPGCRLDCPQK